MNKKILIPFLVPTMLILMIAPCIAVSPSTETFSQVTVLVGIDPGKQFMTGDILHVKGSISEAYQFGAPWGNSISSLSKAITVKLNTVSATGSALLHAVDIYDAGTIEGTVQTKIIGAGSYTYRGPTFTFTLGRRTEEVTNGVMYVGALIEGFAVKKGVSGDLKGAIIKANFIGVNIMVGPLAGVHIVEATGTYKLKG